MAVPVRLDLVADVAGKSARLAGGLSRLLSERRLHLGGLARGLPDPQDLLGAATQRLDDRSERLRLAIGGRFAAVRQRLDLAASGLRPAALAADVARARDRCSDVERRLTAAMARCLIAKRDATDNFSGRLATHSERHESLLARGYVVVREFSGKPGDPERVVTDAVKVRPNTALELEFYDGKVGVIAGGSRRPVRRSVPPVGQGNLFDKP
jgi:exodeoxyribonuclease VII large subunit